MAVTSAPGVLRTNSDRTLEALKSDEPISSDLYKPVPVRADTRL